MKVTRDLSTLICYLQRNNSQAAKILPTLVQKELPTIDPVPIVASTKPFNDQDWLFEIKYDGIRALAYLIGDDCQLVSASHSRLSRFGSVCSAIVAGLKARDCI